MYNINTDRIKEILISPRLLTATFISIIDSCLEPIRWLITELNSFRNSIIARLEYNGQVCSLERLLNDRFDIVDRVIFITDAISIAMLCAYPANDANHHIIVGTAANFVNYPVITHLAEDIGDNLHKFIVNIPDSNEIRLRENELKATVKLYKLAGKGFILRYY